MPKLSESQKSSLKMFLQSPQWQLIDYVAQEYIKLVQARSALGDNAEDTLRNTYLKEGEVQGIQNLIRELFNNIQ